MGTRKIATACFIGGFICAAVAVAVNPMFWWVGILAGFASGYLAYEFREALQAVPVAWQSAKRENEIFWQKCQKALVWFFKPHPFWHSLLLTYCFSLWLCFPIFQRVTASPRNSILEGLLLLTITSMFFCFCFISFLSIMIEAGAKKERCEVKFFFDELNESYYREGKENALTYRQALNWAVRGITELIAAILYFCFWQIWKGIVMGIWKTVCFLVRFFKKFFILIHSQERLLCGIDGTIGGAVAYIWLASSSVSIWENAILCVFGGLIGAGFGIVNYEIVSKRILRLAVNSA